MSHINGRMPDDEIRNRHVTGRINLPPTPPASGGAEPPKKKGCWPLTALILLAGATGSAALLTAAGWATTRAGLAVYHFLGGWS